MGVGTGVQSWVVASRPELPGLADYVLHQCLSAAPWLLATPVVWWAGRTYPLTPPAPTRVVGHLAAALATAAAVNLVMAALYVGTGSPFALADGVLTSAATGTLQWAHVVVIVYAVIAWLGWWSDRRQTPEDDEGPLRLREGGGTFVVRPEDVDWLEADGDHVRVHLGDRVHLVDHTLRDLSDQFEPHGFVRVHRSRTVNVARVRSLQPLGRGDREVLLRCGTRIRVARRRASTLQAALEAL